MQEAFHDLDIIFKAKNWMELGDEALESQIMFKNRTNQSQVEFEQGSWGGVLVKVSVNQAYKFACFRTNVMNMGRPGRSACEGQAQVDKRMDVFEGGVRNVERDGQ